MLNNVFPGGVLLLSVLLLSCADRGATEELGNPVPVAIVAPDDDPHHSGISILPNYVTQIYQSSSIPLVIRGGGFPLDVEPKLTFGFAGPLAESFTCKVVSDGWLELAVVDGHSWASVGGPLMLTKAVFGEHEVTFPGPGRKVAMILDDPFVKASQLHVYATHTRRITIQGHGFRSSFDPSFKPQVVLSPTMRGDYTINDGDWTDTAMTISLMPKSSSEEIEIESKWAEVMGEDASVDIKIVSIDTGAGVVFMPGGGTVVAEVRMDDGTLRCDDSCPFANDGQCDEVQNGENDLMWPGYVRGSNAATSRSQASGSRGYLRHSTILDATHDLALIGPCPIGTDCTDCGISVATLLPTPTVSPSTNIIYLSTSPHMKIRGTNFNEKSTELYFNPPLRDGTDVSIFVKSPTEIWVTLLRKTEGKRWAREPGPLKLVAINTGAGLIPLRRDLGGVTIATMQSDLKGHGISVENHEEISLYQSTQSLAIAGQGFNPDGTNFRFDNSLAAGDNYAVDITETSAVFSLVGGSKWQEDTDSLPGPLVLLAADGGNGYVALGATMAKKGRGVATVFEDPRLEPSDQEISRTGTRELTLKGTGFTSSVFAPLIVFDPHIDPEDYVVSVVDRTHMVVSLAGEVSGWMPEWSTGPLSVQGVDTGAGMFHFEEPVTVATVAADDEPHYSMQWGQRFKRGRFERTNDLTEVKMA